LGSVQRWDSENDALHAGSQQNPVPPRPPGNRQAPANPQAPDRPQEASNSATPDNPEQGEPDPPEEGEELDPFERSRPAWRCRKPIPITSRWNISWKDHHRTCPKNWQQKKQSRSRQTRSTGLQTLDERSDLPDAQGVGELRMFNEVLKRVDDDKGYSHQKSRYGRLREVKHQIDKEL
jgi:hypothetical protein